MNVLLLLTAVAIGSLVSWFALKAILNSECPVLPVSSSSMCVFQSSSEGLMHPFDPTLHMGDLVMIQGVDAGNVAFAYPNSDILVFHFPQSDSYDSGGLVITRVVAKEERDGIVYFRTKSDGVGVLVWPELPSVSECDRWYDYRENYTWNGMISEKLLIGKVVFRIPWIGYIALLVQNPLGILVVVILIIIILTAKFAIPRLKAKRLKLSLKQM